MEYHNQIYEILEIRSENSRLIRSFLSNRQHFELLLESLRNPTLANRRNLDKAFKRFYANARAVKYISKLIHFYSLNYDQKINNAKKRFPLVLDNAAGETSTHVDLVVDESEDVPKKVYEKWGKLEEQIENPELFAALKKLTKNQYRILELYFLYNMKDTEIKTILKISQQPVSKARKKALEILRKELINE